MAITIRGVSELTLQVTDMRRSVKWYTENLELPIIGDDDAQEFVWLKAGDQTRIGLWLPGEREYGDKPGAHVHFAFRVETNEELEQAAKTLRSKGLDVEGPVHHPGKDRSCYVKDPDDHLIEFFTYTPEEDIPDLAAQLELKQEAMQVGE